MSLEDYVNRNIEDIKNLKEQNQLDFDKDKYQAKQINDLINEISSIKKRYSTLFKTINDKINKPSTTINLIDNLLSTSIIDGLSANQGKVLKSYIDDLYLITDRLTTAIENIGGDIPDPVYYSITNNLTNVINSNLITSVKENLSYSSTLSPISGYEISSVSITMNGNNITSSCYSNGNINISNVTGNIVITATATQTVTPVKTYTITKNLTGVSLSNSTSSVEEGSNYSTTINVSTGYTLNSVTVTMGGTNITSTAYNSSNKSITISSVTGNIVITAAATKPTEYMYYGRLSISEVGGSVIQYSAITENMIKTGTNITKVVASTLGKTSLGLSTDTAVGDYVTIAVPSSKGYTVTRDNGIGGKVTFDEDTAGANGIDITIDSIPYKLYGMILLDQAEIFIYID